ncbi:hypothetical protein TVAG_368170 [Trichomonas vaginalis G3]|uniref:Uncharacterized protein n=1 Tax=Trichomonas vaginalis (strain ATCC PRA-98 / G3) TaxID=412133 RepID=A2G9A5_TRIV3|nr:hypothetical protein TVAGG3_0287660 [Trichomonas vaginalis G3]EAX86261.1 hypothetical protein TVAG_368170 [Trichomonas vaginalis G3]KAI5527019.1 hypothetical protein TVAGG3_0287660 [Trichomonas vaginalis G3]|eukprot:XP_001299191.1 hypothetical protein [Trichomonas vaginalis G3]
MKIQEGEKTGEKTGEKRGEISPLHLKYIFWSGNNFLSIGAVAYSLRLYVKINGTINDIMTVLVHV